MVEKIKIRVQELSRRQVLQLMFWTAWSLMTAVAAVPAMRTHVTLIGQVGIFWALWVQAAQAVVALMVLLLVRSLVLWIAPQPWETLERVLKLTFAPVPLKLLALFPPKFRYKNANLIALEYEEQLSEANETKDHWKADWIWLKSVADLFLGALIEWRRVLIDVHATTK